MQGSSYWNSHFRHTVASAIVNSGAHQQSLMFATPLIAFAPTTMKTKPSTSAQKLLMVLTQTSSTGQKIWDPFPWILWSFTQTQTPNNQLLFVLYDFFILLARISAMPPLTSPTIKCVNAKTLSHLVTSIVITFSCGTFLKLSSFSRLKHWSITKVNVFIVIVITITETKPNQNNNKSKTKQNISNRTALSFA